MQKIVDIRASLNWICLSLALITAVFASVIVVESSFGQDIFSDPPPAAARPAASSSVVIDPQLRQLNEMAARGGEELAEALNSLTRIKAWPDADRWLQRGVAPVDDQALLALMANRIGADNLFRLSSSDDISDAAKAAVIKLGKAARAQAEDKNKLAAAIGDLNSESVDVRLAATRRLLGGGHVALGLLVEAAVAESSDAKRNEIVKVMLQLGGGGEQALMQLAIYGAGAVRANALKAIAGIDRRAALPDLLTALYALDTTASESEFAKTQVGGVPSRERVHAFLYAELLRLRRLASESENDIIATTLWTVQSDRKSVVSQPVRAMMLAYRNAVDAGARLRRMGSLPANVADQVIAADLSYRTIIDPDWGTSKQIAAMRAAYGPALNAAALANAISIAIEKDDQPALVGLLRMIGHDVKAGDATFLLSSDSPSLTPLVRAAMNSEPRVRYEATAAIVRLNPTTGYVGSSHVMRCLAEMRALEDRPMAILVETRGDVTLRQETILSRMGYRTEVVGSVLDLERCIERGGDIRLIVSKTQLWDVPPVEMIDRVRRMPFGRDVPIIFYGGFISDNDMYIAMARLKELNARVSQDVEAQYHVLTRNIRHPGRFAELLQRLSKIGDEGTWQDAQARLDTLLSTREKISERTSKESENAWAEALTLAEEKIKVLKLRSEETFPFVEKTALAQDLGINSKRWQGESRLIGRPRTPGAYSELLMDLDLIHRLPQLTAVDRMQFRTIASDYLRSLKN